MFNQLFKAEARIYFGKKWFYASLLFFLVIGYLMSILARFSFPGVYVNSPYTLTYAIGLVSLVNIFTITILSAQIVLREKDAGFDAILYTTPMPAKHFLLSRFSLILLITLVSFFLFVTGFMAGHLLAGNNREKFMDFHAINYLYPFFVLAVPNALLCTAIVSTAGWLTKNKMIIYLSGLFIYILYMVASLYSNSPLFANASPVSAGSMSLMAKLDPFGMAAFFEQTKTWTPLLRNTRLIVLQGNLLFNRMGVLLISGVLLYTTCRFYRFTLGKKEKYRHIEKPGLTAAENIPYKPALAVHTGMAYDLRVLWSFTRIDLRSMLKSIPIVLLVILWLFFLGMEIYSDIDAGIRLPQRYASTGLMVKNIMGSFPFFILVVLLFYGVENLWRSKNVHIAAIEEGSPVNPQAILAAKFLSLSILPILLITVSILFGIALQYIFRYPQINLPGYLLLYYVLGLPAILCAAMLTSIQAITQRKYPGLIIAAVFILLTNSFVGNMVGLQHPLFRFAKAFPGNNSDMNGFGSYLGVFGMKMIYWAAFMILAGIIASEAWGRSKMSNLLKKSKWATWIIVIVNLAILIVTGSFIKSHTVMVSAADATNWQETYEANYRPYQQMLQPSITAVKTSIDLYPEQNTYAIKGSYTLVNKNSQPIDSLLLYCDRRVDLQTVQIQNAKLVKSDTASGHRIYKLLTALQPGDSTSMQFTMAYSWSPYNRHDAQNAIVDNGAFMRISRYYPVFGYQSNHEIDNDAERKKRNMAAATTIKKLEDSVIADYGFIEFEALISTTEKQTAIGTGELVKSWTANNRNYFQYKSRTPIPFRFAISSARYAVKKATYNGIDILVYYHPAHAENVDHLAAEVQKSLAYCEKNFGKYPFNAIRFAEISGYTEGFAATAYPATIFMNEGVVFHADLRKDDKRDVINELAGHELSHAWWGNTQIAPEQREGAAMLTETLAMYTELMLYKQTHGAAAMKSVVDIHQSIFDNGQLYRTDEPLYKVQPGNALLAYNKGLVTMYQLYELIGEEKINKALKHFLANYAFPHKPPTTLDLINEFQAVSEPSQRAQIKHLFMQ